MAIGSVKKLYTPRKNYANIQLKTEDKTHGNFCFAINGWRFFG